MRKKGFSLLEVLVTLAISGIIIVVFGFLMDKVTKVNRGVGKNNDVLSGGLILQDSMYKTMRYTSSNLITIYTCNDREYGHNECWAIGFPVLNINSKINEIKPEQTGYNVDTFKCLNVIGELPKNWDGYIIYLHDKKGEYFFEKPSYFYEIRLNYGEKDKAYRTILIKNTNEDWGKEIGVTYNSSNPRDSINVDFYKNVLDTLLKNKIDKNNVKVLSKNVKAFRVATNSYPAIKMGVLLNYGIFNSGSAALGNNIGTKSKKEVKDGDSSTNYKTENFELNWTVLPLN